MAVLYRQAGHYYTDHAERLEPERWAVRSWQVEDDPAGDLRWADFIEVVAANGLEMAAYFAKGGSVEYRAMIYLLVGEHYGFGELDDYPITMSLAELKQRRPYWRNVH